MPKMKTNRSAYKKFRVSGKGKVKHAHSNRSHNTAKRAAKRMRQLRGYSELNPSAGARIIQLLPYMK